MRIILLNRKISIIVRPISPFNFDGTVFVPQHFPTPDFEWEPGILWQSVNFNFKFLGIKMENIGVTNKPKIKLTIYSEKKLTNKEIKSVIKELNWRYGLDEDISEFCNKFKSDKFLKLPLIKWKGMRVNCSNSLYELLIISIVLQNATVRRTVQMMNNLLEKYGRKLKFDNKELFSFWSPDELNNAPEAELRNLKVGYRAKMIKRISESFARDEIDELKLRNTPTEEARKELLKLYGVGPASVQIILGEYLRRHSVFDLKGRVWEQKIISRILFGRKLVPSNTIEKEFEKRYSRWKGLAFHYIFTNLFWRHRERKIEWLEKEIRL